MPTIAKEEEPERKGFSEMKGFWRHIAASASISAVFIVCALALAVSAAPVATPPAQALEGGRAVSLADSLASMAEALETAAAEVPAEETPATNAQVETAAQPAPATAAPAPVLTPTPAPAAPQPEEPAAQPQPEVPLPQPAAPPPPPVWNPPTNLAGTFVPDVPPYIALTWDPNNPKKNLSYCLIYREVVGQPGQISVVQSNKSPYDDYDITAGLTYRYWVTAVSKTGQESGPSNIIEVETQVMNPPAPPQGVLAAAVDPGVSLDWQPNGESNLAGYNVYLSRNGRWRILNNGVVTDNHYYYDLGTAGQTYAVAAVNVFGIESGYTVVQAQATTPVVYEETDPAVTFEGLWVIEKYVGASGGSIIVAGTAGERLHFAFTGRQVKLIAANYWTCGNARIYIDGDLMATVSMYSYDPVFQSIDVSVPGLKYGHHVLTVEVVGSGNPETTFNFVNVDAFEVR
jgi:hypothetical protein